MTKIHGDPVHHCDWNAMVEGINQNGVLSGLVVSQHAAGADMSVDVAAGSALIDEEKYIESSITNLAIDASESGKHRKDTIIYDTATSAPAVIKGTSVIITSAAAPPSVTDGDILLAVVYIGDSVTEITDSEIYDGRIFISAIKDNWTATTDPDNNDDTNSGYEIGSRWVNTAKRSFFVCTDATAGAAVWRGTYSAATSPATTDDDAHGYTIGSQWVDTAANKEFVCVDATSGAAIWIETTSQLQDDFLEIIRQMHPNVSVLAVMSSDLTQLIDIAEIGENYVIVGQYWLDSTQYWTNGGWTIGTTKTLDTDLHNVTLNGTTQHDAAGYSASIGYTINSDVSTDVISFGSSHDITLHAISIGDLNNGDIVRFWVNSNGSDTGYIDECEIKSTDYAATGNVLTDALAANADVLSFYSHLKGKFSNGDSTDTTPVSVEIFGDGDSYAAALNGTTKLKIDLTDPIIELYRIDDSVVAKSGAQTDWVLDDNSTNGAFPAKTTSTHETILAEEIGCASVVMVEKSVNGTFTDTLLLVEDDDYTIDDSTRTATKIILTTSAASDIVNAQSKLRITWIVDVENIDGTANTALKMKIYLNRTATTEASPEIQPIDLGTGKYAEMKYMCG